MTKEDKLLKIIEGLQDTIRKLEAERITFPVKTYEPYPVSVPFVAYHPCGCNCYQCKPYFPGTITCTATTADKTIVGSVLNNAVS